MYHQPVNNHRSRSPRAALWLLCLLSVVACRLPVAAAHADTPLAAVRRLVDALRANDRAAFREALAEQYDYNGARREELDPFGPFGILSVELYSRTLQLQSLGPGVATALVDQQFLGRFNLEALGSGAPLVSGTRRFWLELRRQPDEGWRVSAVRPVRRRLVSGGWPAGEEPHVSAPLINGQPAARLRPGAAFTASGESGYGNLLLVGVGASAQQIRLVQKENEPWSVELKAPDQPGRYAVAAILIAERAVADGFAIFWDEVTVPIIVE